MKVVVDFDECASNAVCMGILPEVFEVRDDGYLYVLNEHPPEEFREQPARGGQRLPDGRHLHRGRLTPGLFLCIPPAPGMCRHTA